MAQAVRPLTAAPCRADGAEDSAAADCCHPGRFTPTCVGQTKRWCIGVSFAHGSPPRAWGRRRTVHAVRRRPSVHPHVRGADGQNGQSVGLNDRFTPTCVGQTLPLGRRNIRRAGSPPRAWGRPMSMTVAGLMPAGSPPRAWGRRRACSSVTPSCSVHPHVRGADDSDHDHRRRTERFTPTCVGQTPCR